MPSAATHTVNAPDIQGVVPVQLVLHLDREVADDAGDKPMMTAVVGET